jgi:hypothetical protein
MLTLAYWLLDKYGTSFTAPLTLYTHLETEGLQTKADLKNIGSILWLCEATSA